jgi:predicted alpha/beta hydrolase
MGAPASFYEHFAERLRRGGGASVEQMEFRGQGKHPQRARLGANYGYREIVEVDIPAELDRLEACYPGRPIYLVGHSLGGQLAVVAAAVAPARIAGIVLIAAGTAHFRAWPGLQRWRAWAVVQAIRVAARLCRWYPGRRLGFGGDQPRRFMRDWAFNACTGGYRLEGSTRTPRELERILREMRLPVLSIAVRGDRVAPHGAVEHLLTKLPASSIHREVVDGVRADDPWRRHFSWVREPDEIVDRIHDWLAQRPLRAAPPARSPSLTSLAAA